MNLKQLKEIEDLKEIANNLLFQLREMQVDDVKMFIEKSACDFNEFFALQGFKLTSEKNSNVAIYKSIKIVLDLPNLNCPDYNGSYELTLKMPNNKDYIAIIKPKDKVMETISSNYENANFENLKTNIQKEIESLNLCIKNYKKNDLCINLINREVKYNKTFDSLYDALSDISKNL